MFRAYAHRGGSWEAPENSLAAFRRATELGRRAQSVAYLETDVRPSRDGVAVLHHDARLDRTTDAVGPVRERTWSQLRSVQLADGSAPLRLEELLEELPGAHVTLDAKEPGSVAAIADAVRRTRSSSRICVTSFSPDRLGRLRAMLPGVESGAHPREVARLRLGSTPAGLPRPVRVQVPPSAFGIPLVTQAFIARAHSLGLAVDVWTVNDASQMKRLLEMGVDGIMTDSPTTLFDVLAHQGAR